VLLDLSGESKEGINITLIPTAGHRKPYIAFGSGSCRRLEDYCQGFKQKGFGTNYGKHAQGSSSVVYRMYLPEGSDYTIGYTISMKII